MTGYASLPDLISALGGQVIRNTARWVFNAAGVLVPVAPNQIAADHDRLTGVSRGWPFEPARTNRIQNASTAGAALGLVGAGGALPTNWVLSGSTGATATVIEIGVENGIPFILFDWSFVNGTGSSLFPRVRFNGTGALSYTAGNVHSGSVWIEVVSANQPVSLMVEYQTNGGFSSSQSMGLPTASGGFVRRSIENSLPSTGSPNGILLQIGPTVPANSTFTARVKIGLPQLEVGAFASSPILTTGTALTRDADILVLPLGAWHRLEEYLLFARLTPIANVADGLLMQIWDGASFTSGGGIRLRQGSTPTATAVDQRGAGGVDRGSLVTGNAAAGVLRRVAYRRSAAGAARLVTSSGAAVTGTGVDASPAVSQLRIGGGQAAFHLRGLRFEPVIPTDAAMDALVA